MERRNARAPLPLAAAAGLALIVVPVALAAGSGTPSDPQAAASGVQKKVKKLAKKVKTLQEQVAALQGEQGGGRPPSGGAGGDLAGSYPNPEIAANVIGGTELQNDSVSEPKIAADAVGSSEIDSGAVGSPEIATDAVGFSEIAADAVGARQIVRNAVGAQELLVFLTVQARTVVQPSGGVGEATATCPTGARVITGGAFFEFPSGDLSESVNSGNGWSAEGENNGNLPQELFVNALCLQEAL
jgi:hypothetical protein